MRELGPLVCRLWWGAGVARNEDVTLTKNKVHVPNYDINDWQQRWSALCETVLALGKLWYMLPDQENWQFCRSTWQPPKTVCTHQTTKSSSGTARGKQRTRPLYTYTVRFGISFQPSTNGSFMKLSKNRVLCPNYGVPNYHVAWVRLCRALHGLGKTFWFCVPSISDGYMYKSSWKPRRTELILQSPRYG